MKHLLKKEWRLTMPPMPLLFLLLSALVLVPNYPYYVTFFYTTLGVFFYFQSARENRDTAYMLLLPVSKRQMVRAKVLVVTELELLQVVFCVPFLFLRARYAQIPNEVGIEANVAFLGFGLLLLGIFNRIFLPMHFKNGYDIGKPFAVSSAALLVGMLVLESANHVVPYLNTTCDSYLPQDQIRQIPVLLGDLALYAVLTLFSLKRSEENFEKTDL